MPKKSSDDVEQSNSDDDSEDDDEIEDEKEEESDDEEDSSNDEDEEDDSEDDDKDDSDVDADEDDDDDDESDKEEEDDDDDDNDDDDDSDKEEEKEEEDDSEDDSDDDSDDEVDEEDDSDDDYDDYEKGGKPEDFEDEVAFIEPNSSGDIDTPYGGHPDYGEQEQFNDDEIPIENYHWWDGREKIIGIILISCCCLCLIIIGVVVGVVAGGGNNNNNGVDEGDGSDPIAPVGVTPRPTLAPQPLPPSARASPTQKPTDSSAPTIRSTTSPTQNPTKRPTAGPTTSPAPTISIPETVGIVADQDTYVNLNGELQGEEYGGTDTFLVQNGPIKDDKIPDAVGLLSFPFDDLPSFSRLNDTQTNAVLRLTHQVSTAERESANYTIVRIPETRMAVEYLHGSSFLPPQDDIDGVKVGPSFEVNPDDTIIDIDITPLLFDYELDSESEPEQLLLMIQNRGAEQEQGGDRFYSRETSTPPQLLMDFVGGNAADIIISEEPEAGAFEIEEIVDGVDLDFEESDNTIDNGIGNGNGNGNRRRS